MPDNEEKPKNFARHFKEVTRIFFDLQHCDIGVNLVKSNAIRPKALKRQIFTFLFLK